MSQSKSSSGWIIPVVVVGGVVAAVALLLKLFVSDERKVQARAAASRLRELVRAQLARAARILGVAEPPLTFTSRVDNAAANKHGVYFNEAWTQGVLDRYCGDDGSCSTSVLLGVAAHELSHHVFDDNPTVNPHGNELRADHVAGKVMAAAGVPPTDFERVIVELSPICTASHPNGWRRLDAIREGYLAHRRRHGLWA